MHHMGNDTQAATPLTPTPATRQRVAGWRDWRLWLGVALVAACVVAGARLVGSGDRGTPVWAAATDLPVGERVTAADLEVRRVTLGADAAGHYLPVGGELPGDRLGRAVGAGELVPAAALGAGPADRLEVPLAVPEGAVPASVTDGSRVDVWVAAPDGGQGPRGRGSATRVLDDVRVLRAPPAAESFGATGERRLVLAVGDAQADRLGRALAAAATGAVTVVREG